MIDDDALTRALIMAGLGMMQGPTFSQGLVKGGMFGLQGYDQGVEMKRKAQDDAFAQQMKQLQIAQLAQTMSDAQRKQAILQQAAQASQPQPAQPRPVMEVPGWAQSAMAPKPAAPPDVASLLLKAGFTKDAEEYAKANAAITGEDAYGKIDPKDYTPDSMRTFMRTRSRADLVPRDKIISDDLGGTRVYRTEYSTQPLGSATKTVTPGENLENSRWWTNFNRGDLKEVSDPTGNKSWAYIGPGVRGGPPTVTPTGAGAGTNALTESQGNAAGFGLRASTMDATLRDMEQGGYIPSLADVKSAGKDYTNWLATERGQKYMTAADNFTTAVLRKESGATITPAEQEQARRTYIPMPGDKPAELEQKRKNRALAIQSLAIQAGPQGAAKIPTNAPIVVSDVEAEMRRRGLIR